jgi:hypothetical protein
MNSTVRYSRQQLDKLMLFFSNFTRSRIEHKQQNDQSISIKSASFESTESDMIYETIVERLTLFVQTVHAHKNLIFASVEREKAHEDLRSACAMEKERI